MTDDHFLQVMRNRLDANDIENGVALLIEFKEAGGTQADAYHLLASLRNEPGMNEDLVLDLLDLVTGWCYPSNRIWPGQYRPDDKV